MSIAKRRRRKERRERAEGGRPARPAGRGGGGGRQRSKRKAPASPPDGASRRFSRWFLGGDPGRVLSARWGKVLVAFAIAILLFSILAIVAELALSPVRIYEEYLSTDLTNFTISTERDEIGLIVTYEEEDWDRVVLRLEVRKLPTRELVKEGNFTIKEEENIDTQGYQADVGWGMKEIDLGGPGTYQVSLVPLVQPGDGVFNIIVIETSVPTEFWTYLPGSMLVLLSVCFIGAFAVHRRNLRSDEAPFPMRPLLVVAIILAISLLIVYL